MKKLLSSIVASLVILLPVQVFAKSETTKITITGGDLKAPVILTDLQVLAPFKVWAGPGTSFVEAQSFIVNWPMHLTDEPPSGLKRYQVSFFAMLPREQLIYFVFYEYDPSTGVGYVYLPGRADKWYDLNVSTIFRGVEGTWHHASKPWDKTAARLLSSAKGMPQIRTDSGH